MNTSECISFNETQYRIGFTVILKMHSQYQGQVRPQGPFMPPYPQNSTNSFDMNNAPANKGYPPVPQANTGMQNGQPNSFSGQTHNHNQPVQSTIAPPNSHINNQMSQEFNAMHIAQNKNQALLTNNQHPSQRNNMHEPHVPSIPNQQQYWQQPPRSSPVPRDQYQNPPANSYPVNANNMPYPNAYSNETFARVQPPNNNIFPSTGQRNDQNFPAAPQSVPPGQRSFTPGPPQGDRTFPTGPPPRPGLTYPSGPSPTPGSNRTYPTGPLGGPTFTPVQPQPGGPLFPPGQSHPGGPPFPPGSSQAGGPSFPPGHSQLNGAPGQQQTGNRSFTPGPPPFPGDRTFPPPPVSHGEQMAPASQQNGRAFTPTGPPLADETGSQQRTFPPVGPPNAGPQQRTFPPQGPPMGDGPPRRPVEQTFPSGQPQPQSFTPGPPAEDRSYQPGPPGPPGRMPNQPGNFGPSNQQPLSVYTNGTQGAPPGQYQHMNSNMPGHYPPSQSPVPGQAQPASQYGPPNAGIQNQNRLPQPPPNRRLDPDNMPSPIQVIEDDRKLRSCCFPTAQRGLVPPLVTTNFTVIDEGICSPRFIRSTIYNVPTTAEILKLSCVPFALAISPFAQVHEDENPPSVSNPGEDGPVRCHRCRAYMSPHMQFIDAGRRFQCTMCKTATEVPAHYFTHLDHMGQRVDKYERPELCLGSYEFIVNKDYCKEGKFPNCPAFIFLIDVSYNSIRSGMVKTLCDNMKSVLENLPRENGEKESKLRVGFVTYSTSIHFFNINKNLAQPQMLVVSDVHDMFMPLLDGFLVNPSEATHVIDSLMVQIPIMFADTKETETVLGPAIQAGVEALKAAECAGKLFVFHSTLPIAEAPGKLKSRDDRKLLGTEKEKTILSPQTTFYNNLGQECVKAGCSVDLFLFNNAYIDLATLGQVCRLTGGCVYKYTYFQADIDGERFVEDLRRDVEKPIAFDAVLRVRTSTGIRPTDFTGSFFMSNTTDVELASITADQSLAVEIKYDDKLAEEEGVFIQCAVLYTSCGGQRRLRVHNLALNSCSQLAELFRNCELDTILNVFLKEGVRRVTEENPKQIRESLVSRSAQVLACYRKNCAQASSAGQLILPECMKLLPLYINCLIKCDAISGAQEISTDDRSFIMLTALNMDVDSSAAYLYPRLIPMHEIEPKPDSVEIPTAIRCSIERLKENGVYLIENGLSMFMWVGMNAESKWIQEVFGVNTVAGINIEQNKFFQFNNPLSECVRTILNQIQSERHRQMKLYIVRQGDKSELLFRQLLVEDRTTEGSASYVDFLCHLHKEIRTLLS
ncbi:hypothetical protein JTE90_001808 [Oedothorax gibbosus]|uniref:Protein transport protein Sec24C n=1 Tax=Oedothorax gibbosus TaxID=931172 RepID=A0AAV6VSH1_9ARAC|nr:hypothetical protein JTE90_001808 [Oedothorax gibbosus]